ncbi:MAG: ribonuclease E/G, partial [Bryobacteraceae bacterium]
MSKELVISSNRHETKVAILEDDQLVEVYFQRANEYSLAGSIHKGRVTRVLPGMQSAFVDLGLERDTFLYVSDFFEENEEYDRIGAADEKPAKGAPRVEVAKSGGSNAPPPKVAEAAAGESSGAGAAHALERSDEDPRRGRRSRRRRSRGRGFPESKYVSGPSTSEPVERSLVEEPEPEIEPAEDREVFLLPGESLAKYGSSGSQGGPEKISEARPVAQEAEEEIFRLQDDGDVAEPLPEGLDNEPEQLPEQVRAAKEPEAQSEEQTQPQPGDDKALVSSMSAAEETVEELIDAAPEEESSNEEAIEQAGLPVTDTAAPMLGDSGVSTFEDDVAFIEAMAGTEEDDEAMESTPSEPESTQPVTAAVREQGSRYLHRSSRRMRRRGRGGEGRTAAAAEAGIPAASAGIQAEIQRPVVRPEKSPLPSITDLLREGQEIIVQIAKEPLGQKGARITSHIALPGRYVVYMPTLEHLGVSRKIASDEERARLKKILQAHRTGISGGYI